MGSSSHAPCSLALSLCQGAPEWACVALLETLLVLQAYWFWLILKVAVKLIITGKVEDVRSDDEDEDDTKRKQT